MNKMRKIVITGAESTGKSTLAEQLSNHYNVSWIPEFARQYLDTLNRKYTYADVEAIALHQIKIENELQNKPLVFFDTWLIITKVWFDFVYGKHPAWLHQAILNSNIDLFLLCDIDVPWVEDPLRENGGENRNILHQIYLNELKTYNFEYRIVSGLDQNRLQTAINFVNQTP